MLTSKRVQTRKIIKRGNKYKPAEKNKLSHHHFKSIWKFHKQSGSTEVTFCNCSWPSCKGKMCYILSKAFSYCLAFAVECLREEHAVTSLWVKGLGWISTATISEMPSGKQKFCKHKNITISNIEQSQQCILIYLCLKQTLHSFVSWGMSGSCYLLFQLNLFLSISASQA